MGLSGESVDSCYPARYALAGRDTETGVKYASNFEQISKIYELPSGSENMHFKTLAQASPSLAGRAHASLLAACGNCKNCIDVKGAKLAVAGCGRHCVPSIEGRISA